MFAILKEYFISFFDLFYPDICVSCSQKLLRGESILCLQCELDLPKTDFWNNPENALVKRFWGRVNLLGASALYRFQKGGGVQYLLHQLKYRGRQDIGDYIGNKIGHTLKEDTSLIKNVDLILPVPLHWKKLRTRGYNQCDSVAEGISKVTNIPFSTTCIERVHENISQTKKKSLDRWENVSEIFKIIDTNQLTGKHILLVDDVVTTGATAEACLKTILSVPETKVSFVAVAMAIH